MSTWTDTKLVAGREVDEKLHSKPFLYSMVFFVLILVASLALPALLSNDDAEKYDVAVVGEPAQGLVLAARTEDVEATPKPYDSVAAAEQAVRDEDVDAALVTEGTTLRLVGLEEVPDDLRSTLAGVAQIRGLSEALSQAGTPSGELTRLLSPVDIQVRELDPGGLDPDKVLVIGLVFAMVFFFVVYLFGFAIAQTVVQEKESRVVELLVAAVPIRTLLAGKVLGNTVLALGQLVILVAVALGGAAATGQGDIVSVLAKNSAWFLIFFLLGFVVLACLFAVAGAFATRNEDLQSTTAPLQALVLLPFFASVYVTDGVAQKVLSYVPFSAPLVMPQRLVAGDAALWEAGLSALLMLVTAVALMALGSRLYRASLLRTRGKTSLGQALAATRS